MSIQADHLSTACVDPPRAPARDREAVIELARAASLEMGVQDADTIEHCKDLLRPGTRINITAFPNQLPADTGQAARRVREAGFEPIPHIAVRLLPSHAALTDLLGRLQGEAAISEVLLIAGDRPQAAGPFASVADVMRTEELGRYGIARVGVAGHPEGHPHVGHETLRQAALEKVSLAASQRLQLRFVTQFAFTAAPIIQWLGQLRSDGISADVTIGVAGPARLATLVKFAARCGVGASLSALGSKLSSMVKLVGDRRPDVLIREFSRARAAGTADFQGIHFFSFGGLPRTCRWIHALSEGRFEITGAEGFQLE